MQRRGQAPAGRRRQPVDACRRPAFAARLGLFLSGGDRYTMRCGDRQYVALLVGVALLTCGACAAPWRFAQEGQSRPDRSAASPRELANSPGGVGDRVAIGCRGHAIARPTAGHDPVAAGRSQSIPVAVGQPARNARASGGMPPGGTLRGSGVFSSAPVRLLRTGAVPGRFGSEELLQLDHHAGFAVGRFGGQRVGQHVDGRGRRRLVSGRRS